jgi:aspartate-semialdehyde dehydrogenase
MLQILEERQFPVTELIPVASERSAGKTIPFKGKNYLVVTPENALKLAPNVALFSAGGNTSKEWAPQFAAIGCTVIDNSSAWRMDPEIPLVVPEVNGYILQSHHKIIANPNCSTIQMVMALHPIHQKNPIQRIVVSTYQSVTGTGKAAVDQLENEIRGIDGPMAYAFPIFKNAIPQIDVFSDDDYTKEELKMMRETQKIMGSDAIQVTATTVRIPVMGGHSESVNLTLQNTCSVAQLKEWISSMPGVVLMDDPKNQIYPMPLNAHERDEVFVGRVRIDRSFPNSFNLWIVSDNLRKGAATNAIQVAEYLLKNGMLSA